MPVSWTSVPHPNPLQRSWHQTRILGQKIRPLYTPIPPTTTKKAAMKHRAEKGVGVKGARNTGIHWTSLWRWTSNQQMCIERLLVAPWGFQSMSFSRLGPGHPPVPTPHLPWLEHNQPPRGVELTVEGIFFFFFIC